MMMYCMYNKHHRLTCYFYNCVKCVDVSILLYYLIKQQEGVKKGVV